MDKHHGLPFRVGQLAESKSFLAGYRGAWFRCKIKEISFKNGKLAYALEFFDFPDEKISWTQVYQKPPYKTRGKEIRRQLMVRPCFPPFYQESKLPDIGTISELPVIVVDVWKVGDLVDWWSDDCYWSGRITKVLSDDKVQIVLPEPPVGEGQIYEAYIKYLRPSLDWSPEDGWKLPLPLGTDNYRHCARFIGPSNQGILPTTVTLMAEEGRKEAPASKLNASLFSPASASPFPPLNEMSKDQLHRSHTNMDLDMGVSEVVKTSRSDSASSSHVAELAGDTTTEEEKNNNSESIFLNIDRSDSLEATILDLEELVDRVKWLKQVLEVGVPLSNSMRSPWEFLEHRAPSILKE